MYDALTSAMVNAGIVSHKSAIHRAIEARDTERVRELLEGPLKVDLIWRDDTGIPERPGLRLEPGSRALDYAKNMELPDMISYIRLQFKTGAQYQVERSFDPDDDHAENARHYGSFTLVSDDEGVEDGFELV